MVRRNSFIAFFASVGMLVLIFDSKTALWGAADGIRLCLTVLIPSMFPFFILSVLVTGSLSGQAIPILRPITKLCKIPQGCESVLAAGFLGGYPVGSQNVGLLYRSGQLTAAQAARMISFCNNAGPAFIFGVLSAAFSSRITPWLIWVIHMLSAVSVAILLPSSANPQIIRTTSRQIRITEALEQAVRVMSLVCGWVIFARLLIAFLDRWFLWIFPQPLQVAICGLLELSNGCIRLSQLPNEGFRFVLACALLSVGGVCVTLQTASVTGGISMKYYFPGKLLHCCISIMLSSLLLPIYFGIPIAAVIILVSLATIFSAVCILSFRIFENNSRISATVSV